MYKNYLSLRRGFLAIMVLVMSSYIASAQPIEQRALSPIDMIELQRLDAPQLSPDGQKLLHLKSQTVWAENEIVDRLVMMDIASGDSHMPVEPEEADEDFGQGVWAPDSSGFLTVLEREDDEDAQAYFYSLETETLERLTNHGTNVGNVFWAPDGHSFFFTARSIPDPETERLRDGDWTLRAYDAPDNREIWQHDLTSGESRLVIGGDYSIRRPALSRDGAAIIYLRTATHLLNDIYLGELWVYDLANGEERQLTNNEYGEASPQLSPSNLSFAYIATVNENGEPYYEDNLFVQTVDEQTPQLLMPDEAMEVLDFAWDKQGTGLYVLGNIGVRSELFHVSIDSGALRRLTAGDHAISDWSYDPVTGMHTMLRATAENPGEVYLLRGEGAGLEQVTSEYEVWAEAFLLPRQEAVTWPGRRGVTVEGVLAYPIGYVAGQKFPLVTITHGGPRQSSQFGSWNYSRYVSVLAGQGYGVLLPNHRGSTGYGDAFMRDMVGRYFRNAHHDLMDGVDAMVERGFADPDRLVIMGWSAGGHMTNKIITITDRFKAASSGAGASDWVSMVGESDVRDNRAPWFGGLPWGKDAPRRSYARQSVLTDAWRVTTPTLFFNGGSDVRVPPTQAIMMHRAVRAAGAPTELYVASGEPHGWRKPANQLFKLNTELTWFAEHALGETFVPVLPEEAFAEDDSDEASPEEDTSCGSPPETTAPAATFGEAETP